MFEISVYCIWIHILFVISSIDAQDNIWIIDFCHRLNFTEKKCFLEYYTFSVSYLTLFLSFSFTHTHTHTHTHAHTHAHTHTHMRACMYAYTRDRDTERGERQRDFYTITAVSTLGNIKLYLSKAFLQ